MFFTPNGFMEVLAKAASSNDRHTRIAFGFLVTALLSAGVSLVTGFLGVLPKPIAQTVATAFAVSAVLIAAVIAAYQEVAEQEAREQKIETVERQLREHPEKPQLAWDLARVKLENYLDRNLSQVRSIYWLTLVVMLCGFGFVSYGLFQASQEPDKLPMSIVASASGVLISFIGGSFLLIYRSILAQSKDYVTVLERINAVGMAVQVISSIPDEGADLKNQAKAGLAKQLLTLYATSASAALSDHPPKG